MYDHIIVCGNGKTSRANVEALVDDYIHANTDVLFTIYNPVRLSEGQVWLRQYLADKEIKHKTEIGGTVEVDDPAKAAMFILWEDEDPESLEAIAVAKELGLPAFDLTEGLVELTPSANLTVTEKPAMPEHDNLDEEEPLEDDEDVEYDSEVIIGEALLMAAVQVIANTIADAVAREVKKALKK